MQATKFEIFMLNWEISDLTSKLQTFANVYSVIDLKTVDSLNKLIMSIDVTLSKVSCTNSEDMGRDDNIILQGYNFHHSINCKKCDRAIKIAKPSLLRHLEVCRTTEHNIPLHPINTSEDVKTAQDVHKTSIATNEAAALSKNKPNNKKPKAPNSRSQSNHLNSSMMVKKTSKLDETDTYIELFLNKLALGTNMSSRSSNSGKNVEGLQHNTKAGSRQKKCKSKMKINKEHKTPKCVSESTIKLNKKVIRFLKSKAPQVFLDAVKEFREGICTSPAQDNIVKNLEDLLKPHFPNVKAYPFGSRITGLGTESSDLDVYLDLEGNYEGSQNYTKEKIESLVLIAKYCLQSSDHWSDFVPITSARTPILRAWNNQEKIDCDLSFTNGLSHCNTKLIQYLFELQPVCYYVTLYIKEWARRFNMDGLNTYTLVLLTIFYFQTQHLLPAIHTLQKDCKNQLFITDWQANFETKSLEELGIPQISESAAEQHIIKFFSYYGNHFEFETNAICPFLGYHLEKNTFHPKQNNFPNAFRTLKNYYAKLDLSNAHPIFDVLSYKKPLVVQDPFELIHNVAKRIRKNDVVRFKRYCALTATWLADDREVSSQN